MRINTFLTPLNAEELYFTNKVTVVIDVLRATTTIVTALKNKAKEVIPVSSVEFAMKLTGNSFTSHSLLCGERNTIKIEGFSLGNSPLEYTEEFVKGKSIVFFTTNGSKAIVKAKFSESLFILSFLNINAVANKILKLDCDLEILCSGNNGKFSYEDSACAGMLIEAMVEKKQNLVLNDESKICQLIYLKNKRRILKMLKETEHGVKLFNAGFEEDIKFSSQQNIYDIAPVFKAGVIKLD